MVNPALSSGQLLPGFFGHVDYGATAAPAPQKRALLWGYIDAAAIATPNRPFRPDDETDAISKTGSTKNDLVRDYRSAIAQDPFAEVWLMPLVAPSGGVASTYKHKVLIPGTNPSKSSSLQLWVASQQIGSVSFTATDTATTIGDGIAAALLASSNSPIGNAVNAAGVITITYPHKGTTGEDYPIRATVATPGTGVSLSPAQLLFATNATGAGSAVVQVGEITVTTALAGGETPAQIASKVQASFAADSYPCTAVVDGGTPAQVNLIFAEGWDVRRITASIVGTTGTTVNAGSGATDGTGSSASTSTNGTVGTGAPSVSGAITNLTNAKEWYRSWSVPWTDATTLGTLAGYIESASDGSITGQKLQILTVADWRSLATAGAVPPSTSPSLTASNPHYAYGWAPGAPVQVKELTARIAAARATKWIDAPAFNWNGYQFKVSAGAPILAPKYVPSLTTLNSALRTYAMAPWVQGDSGSIEVIKGRTTSLASDLRLWAWSSESQASYHIQDAASTYAVVFKGKSIVRYSDPKAPGLVDAKSFEDVTKDLLHKWERQGNYDGADLLEKQVLATPNDVNPFRMDVTFPESPVLDLDQVVFESHFTQPSV